MMKNSIFLMGVFGLLAFAAWADFRHLQVHDLKVLSEMSVSGDWMGIADGSLWLPSGGTLYRVNATGDRVLAKIPIGATGPYRGVGVGFDSVWIPNTGDQTIYRVDPRTNRVSQKIALRFSGSEGSIGVGEGALWVATQDASAHPQLTRLDPTSGAVVAQIALPARGDGVVADFGAVWVTSTSGGKLYKIDGQTNRVAQEINLGGAPRFVTSGAGSVWTLNQTSGYVQRVNPQSGAIINTIDGKWPGGGGDITFGEGKIWVTLPGAPVSEIDPATNLVVAKYEGYGMGDAIRAGLGSVWVSGSTIHRIQIPSF